MEAEPQREKKRRPDKMMTETKIAAVMRAAHQIAPALPLTGMRLLS